LRVLLLSEISSVHTIKWANSLSAKNLDIMVFGLKPGDEELYSNRVKIRATRISEELVSKPKGSLLKFPYISAIPKVRKLIKEFKPDIIHSHYISSYGIIGSLTGFHPLINSVWGSDIFTFPYKSFLHKKIIKYVLSKSDRILSTSRVMSEQTSIFTNKKIEVTPFGIDTEQFVPFETESIFSQDEIVIGTIKGLEDQYGIDYLLKSFQIVKQRMPGKPLKLLIAGKGSLEQELKNLSVELGIQDDVVFTGEIPFVDVPAYHNMIDIFAALSISESFGVAVIEASSCEKPVVVSDSGGLPEVVEHNVSGIVVPQMDVEKAAEAFIKLIEDEQLRKKLGKAGRIRVKKLYDWNVCVQQMISIYQDVLNERVN
jgi:L-malate glycosyltransferase